MRQEHVWIFVLVAQPGTVLVGGPPLMGTVLSLRSESLIEQELYGVCHQKLIAQHFEASSLIHSDEACGSGLQNTLSHGNR